MSLEHRGHRGHREGDVLDARLNDLSGLIVDAGMNVHRALGPGLLESVYEHCLCHELNGRGVSLQRQKPLPITYDGQVLEVGFRIDILVDDRIVVEIKSVEALTRLHEAQLLTYLRLSKRRLGLLLNSNVEMFKSGVKRLVF